MSKYSEDIQVEQLAIDSEMAIWVGEWEPTPSMWGNDLKWYGRD